jgi:hypothetical protein
MPLRWVGTELRLVCANAYPPAEGTFVFSGQEATATHAFSPAGQEHKMRRFGARALWRVVSLPETPEEKAVPPNVYMALYVYSCETCGYVETYMADVVEVNEAKRAAEKSPAGPGDGPTHG